MKIYDLIKISLEKNFIYTLISIAVTFLMYFFTSNDCVLLAKFGMFGYLIFIFIIVYLIIIFLVCFYKKVFSRIERHRIANEKQYDMINENSKLLWDKVDEL